MFFSTRLWPFLGRQGGERSLTIDDLCDRSRYRRRTSPAAPARSPLPRLGPLCATLFPAGLGPRARLALGRDAGTRSSYRDGGLAEPGVGPGAAGHDLPLGPPPGHLLRAPGQSDAARAAPHGPGAPRGHDRPRCRRHGGTPGRAAEHSDRRLPGCGALPQNARPPLLGLAVGVQEALGAGALEPARGGVALFDRTRLAPTQAPHTTAYHQRGGGAAEDETGAARAAGAAVRLGRRGRLRGRGAGAGLWQTSGAQGLALARGGGAVSPPGPPPQGQRGPQPTQGQRQRRWQGGAERRETPGEPGAVPWSSGQRTKLWGFSRPARW